MLIRNVTDQFAVAPQITREDVDELADAGFRCIICNRPDNEEPGQPPVAAIAEAASARGLRFEHIPISGGQMTEASVEQFADCIASSEGPVLAFCRSGTRSINLWALSQAGKIDAETIIKSGADAGYDLSGLRGFLNR